MGDSHLALKADGGVWLRGACGAGLEVSSFGTGLEVDSVARGECSVAGELGCAVEVRSCLSWVRTKMRLLIFRACCGGDDGASRVGVEA